MQLGGYIKLTLQDYPGKVAAMCFTKGCQLNCPYCHNPEFVLSRREINHAETKELTDEFISYIEQRKSQLDGVVISGGEPLLQQNIHAFLQKIKAMGLAVKLDTNGLLPYRLQELIMLNLVDYVALDYKGCSSNFAAVVGMDRPEQKADASHHYNSWQASLNYLRENQIPYEIRTTVVRELHSPKILVRMAEMICQGKHEKESWFLQAFVNSESIICDYTNQYRCLSAYTKKEMGEIHQRLLHLAPGVRLRE